MYLVTDQKKVSETVQSSLLGHIVQRFRSVWSASRGPSQKRMQVIETLSLGAKKQLVLVSCDGERLLVGAGPDHVQTIVRLGPRIETVDSRIVAVAGECV